MKLKILYTLLFILMISCKTETKQTIKKSENLIVKVSDTIKNEDYLSQKKTNKLIGKIYSKIDEIEIFKEYSSGGATIGDSFKGKEYAISSIVGKGDMIKYIIFEESLSSNNSKNRFKILDILDLTGEENYELLKNKNNSLYYHFCYKDNKNDQEIIAIAEYDEYAEYLTKIHKAWQADRKIEKIIEIPTTGIKVENVDYGL